MASGIFWWSHFKVREGRFLKDEAKKNMFLGVETKNNKNCDRMYYWNYFNKGRFEIICGKRPKVSLSFC